MRGGTGGLGLGCMEVIRALRLGGPRWQGGRTGGSATLGLFATLLVFGLCASTAAALPQERVYEMVSPPFKAGNGVNLAAAAEDGERVEFESIGVFSGEPSALGTDNIYVASRGPDGWSPSPLNPPESLAGNGHVVDGSPDLTQSLSFLLFGHNYGQAEVQVALEGAIDLHNTEAHDTNESYVQATPVLKTISGKPLPGMGYAGASSDLSHLVLSLAIREGTALLPADTTNESIDLYEVAGAGGSSPALRLVAVNNSGEPIDPYCNDYLGTEVGLNASNPISSDGSRILFTANTNPETRHKCDRVESSGEEPNNPAQLFVRVKGVETLEISKPFGEVCAEVPCAGALGRRTSIFRGASENGSKVFFTTTQSLLPADKDSANDLYMAEIGEKSGKAQVEKLRLVSEGEAPADPHPGDGAEVQGVLRVSPDGSRVYFVALGVLSGANVEGRSPVAGEDNLYVWEPNPEAPGQSTVVFIGDLAKADGELAEHGGGELFDGGESQTASPNGRFLVFSSFAQLITTGPEADTDSAKDIYRYDAATGRLTRVSIGEGGYDENGNNSSLNAKLARPQSGDGALERQHELDSRAISEDGSAIVFTTAEPLSAAATNGRPNVYEWYETPSAKGQVAMISRGTSPTADGQPMITPSGRDIFFTSNAQLALQDTDELADVYDARIRGGFPPQPVAPGCLGDDGCQGALSAPPAALPAFSVTQTGGGNVIPMPTTTTVKLTRTQKLADALKACRKKLGKRRTTCESQARKRYDATRLGTRRRRVRDKSAGGAK